MTAQTPPSAVAEEVTTPDGRRVLVRRDSIHVTASGMVDEENAAAYLQCSARSLQRYRQQRRGPCYRVVSGRVWYPLAELDEYLRLCSVDPLDS
ncbi:helix-turn-helix domain-containing protein [Tahibacter caeni]|uniref:helix-turn-helix domain-containing protein n=1 Tax=Tahibacter caeni TaxID=1453545 RepID=UPI002147EFC3|nr:helix-turn-helix domain-containing protein [Tahibacter caeni]